MNWVDIVVLVIILLTAVVGLWRGLFESVLSLISTGLAIFIAILVSKPVASFLNKVVNLDGLFVKAFSSHQTITFLGKTFTVEKIASLCTIVIAIIAVWLLIKLAIFLLSRLFNNMVSRNSAISGLNRVLGLVFGVVKGMCIVLVVLGLTFCLSKLPFVGDKIEKPILNSGFVDKIYNYVSDFVEDKLGNRINNVVDSLTGSQTPQTPETPETPDTPETTPTTLETQPEQITLAYFDVHTGTIVDLVHLPALL